MSYGWSTKLPPSVITSISIIMIVSVWQTVCSAGWVNPLLLSSPASIAQWLIPRLTEKGLWNDVLATVGRVSVALLVSVLIGVPIGMALGRMRLLERVLRFPMDFARSIPATALFPLFMLLFGAREGSRVAAAIYGASLIILMNTMAAVRQVSAVRMRTARAYGATGWRMYVYVLVPESLPGIIVGIRLAASLSFVVIVLVEMFIGTTSGLGHRIIEAQLLYEIPEMYSTILIAGTLGYCFNMAFVLIESRFGHYIGR